MNTINVTPIVEALIGLLAAVITAFVIPWVKAHTTQKNLEIVRAVASVAVKAAEQIYGANHGADKLNYAKQYCVDKLELMGLYVDEATIEAAVHELRTDIFSLLEDDKEPDLLKEALTDDGK